MATADTKVSKDEPVKVVEASTPMPLERPDPHAKGPWVVYTGFATVRIFSEKDWDTVGLKGKRCEWNYLNQKRLPKSQFTAEQLDHLLNVDGRFKLSDEK